MNTQSADFSVRLNKETFDLLIGVRNELIARLGFVPTNGQVIRHLIALYHGQTR